MLCEAERDFDRECAWQESNLRNVPARGTHLDGAERKASSARA
jgi:hypothetical protein